MLAMPLKQSTAKTLRMGPFVDSTDGVTAETGLTIAQADIQISKNGGAFAQTSDSSPTTTHDMDGWYQIPLTATDTDTLGPLTVQVVMSGALPIWKDFLVVPANVYDSMVAGTDTLEVDAVAVSGDTTAANNLESDYDGTGYTKTNSVIGTVISVTSISAAVDANITQWAGTNVATPDTAGYPKVTIKAGTGTGELSLSSGTVTVGTNSDKTGYSLTQTFPTNFADLTITSSTGLVSVGTVAANALTASALATDAVNEIRDAITGGSYSLDTDANGRIRLVSGTGAGEISFTSGVVQSDAASISGSTAAADNLEASAGVIIRGAAATGTLSTTQMTTNLTEATDDHYNGRVIIWTSGALLGQATDITDYTGSTKLLTFTAVTESPSNGDTFVIV